MWRPEVALHFSFEFLTEHKTLQSGNMGWPVTPRYPVSASAGAGVTGACHHTRVSMFSELMPFASSARVVLTELSSSPTYYLFVSLCVYCAHMCVTMLACMHAHSCSWVWWLKVGVICLPSLLSTYLILLRQGLFLDPACTHLLSVSQPAFIASQVGGLQEAPHMLCGLWGSKLWSLRLNSKHYTY